MVSISLESTANGPRYPRDEPPQDSGADSGVALPCGGLELLGGLRRKVPVVLVDVDAGAQAIEVEFGMETGGSYTLALHRAAFLHRAAVR